MTSLFNNSVCTCQIRIYMRIYLVSHCLKIIYISSYTEMPIMPTSCISKSLNCPIECYSRNNKGVKDRGQGI